MLEASHQRPSSPRSLAPATADAAALDKNASSAWSKSSTAVGTNLQETAASYEESSLPVSDLGSQQTQQQQEVLAADLDSTGAHQTAVPAPPTPELPFAIATPTEKAMPQVSASSVASAASVRPLSSTMLPAVGTSEAVSSDTLSVLGSWYAMYQPEKEAQLQAALQAGFDRNIVFEDNFLQITGHDQMNALFYCLQRCTDHIHIRIEKIEVFAGDALDAEAATGAGGALLASRAKLAGVYQIRIVGRHAFYLPKLIRGPVTSLVLPPALDQWATDVLTVRESDNKIIHWQQRVHNIAAAPGFVRLMVGFFLSILMTFVLGW